MKLKIKTKFLKIFNNTDCVGVFDLNLSSNGLTAGSRSVDPAVKPRDDILNRDIPFFEKWIQKNKHAEMHFLEKNEAARKDPSLILENAKTALIFLFPYAHGHRVRGVSSRAQDDARDDIISKKLISKYTYAKDYHKIIKKNLTQYALSLQNELNLNFSYRPIVDSVPFLERAHARETGLGFIGKNTLLIRPGMGSFFFIGTLLTDLDISILAEENTKNNPILNLNCGDCRRCIDACPTQALEDNYTLNANKCLSYLTIEHRDTIPNSFLKNLDKTIYGCDICQDVCPYNFVTQNVSMLTEFKNKHEPLLTLTANEIATMTELQYQKWFGGTAMTRARYEGLVRNALYYLFANKVDGLKKYFGRTQKFFLSTHKKNSSSTFYRKYSKINESTI